MSGALLVDVDSTIPNLALMKISAWRKAEGLEAGFNITDPDEVWASVVFRCNRHKADGLRFMYPDAKVDIGGSGYDLAKRLPDDVDRLMPDYSLYPDSDYDIGFSSRGFNRACPFCIVSKKEGRFQRYQHPREFHDPRHKSIVLLDNSILWDTDWFMEVTDWIIENKLKVDFNQGLDIRLLEPSTARRIAELRPKESWRFAFDMMNYRDDVERGLGYLRDAGVKVRNRVQVYVYVDSDDYFDDALERCNLLKLWGATPYIMLNMDAVRTRRLVDLKRWTWPQFFWQWSYDEYVVNIHHGRIPDPMEVVG